VVIVAFFTCCWGILWLALQAFGYSVGVLQSLFINTIIVALMYIYPFLVRIALSAFLCKTIEPGQQWLRADLAMRCWDKRHLTYTLAGSLPSLLIWGVGLPALATLHLTRERRKTGVTGFLRGGVKDEHYLWTVGMGLYKACVAVLYVFTAPLLSSGQALILMGVLSLALVFQRKHGPYKEAVCNRVAVQSAVVWGTYSGVFFSSSGSSMLLVLVLCVHGWFLLSWAVAVSGTKQTPVLWLLCFKSRKQ